MKRYSILTVVIASILWLPQLSLAAKLNNNQENKNMSTQISVGKNQITFKSQGVKLSGLLYTPADFDASATYPTIIFSGPFNQIKEQMGAVYGEKMAALGYVFLSFDHLGYGDSEGELRDNENPFIKMESIRDAISYLGTLPFVDRDKLFGLGGCASGGYIPIVATTDKRLKAIATVSGMMDNTGFYFKTMTKEQLVPLFKMANLARQKAYETGEMDYYDALNMDNTDPENEGYDYYMTKRAGKETYPNYTHMAPMTLMEVAPLTSGLALAPYLYTPYLGIYGEKAKGGDIPTAQLTIDFYEAASEPKELFEVKGATHVSLYDIDEDVDQAVAKMDEFFAKYSN